MRISFALLLLVAAVSASAAADDVAAPADPRAAIAAKFPGSKPEQVKPSPVKGIFQIEMGGETAYVSADGKFLFSGDLYDIDSRTNLTEVARTGARSKALAKLDERDMIIFSPAAAKHTITVFTDVDCCYCRKLHSEIEQLTKLGVRVRYMAYPRSGPGTEDWKKMEQVWCSKDRKDAITKAKQGEAIKVSTCGATPVGKQFELGEQLGVRGTPAIFTPSGDYIGGYLPPNEMVKQLEQLEKVAAQAK